jgi:predicted nucleotidyltransferase
MPYFLDIERDVQQAFSRSRPDVVRICLEIATYLRTRKQDARLHLTLSLLRNETKPQTDVDLMVALQYLTGGNERLLEMNFEYAAETGEFFPLTRDLMAQGLDAVALYLDLDSVTHEKLESDIMVYFTPSDRAQEAIRELEFA